MDCSLPGSSVCGFLQARILQWVAIPSPRDLPNPGIEPRSPALQVDSLPAEPQGKPIRLTDVISLVSKGLSRVFSNTTVQKHQFFGTQLSSWSNSHICTSVQFSSVTQSCPTLCDPMDCSTPGFPVHHQLSAFTQTHVH